MRTFLSQLATDRWSDCEEKRMRDTLSSGTSLTATSLVRSPWVGLLAEAAEEAADPKSDMSSGLGVVGVRG